MSPLMQRLCGAALAAITTLSAAPGHAQIASATADMSSIRFRLIDLDVGDGITPAITLSPLGGAASLRASYSMYDDGIKADYKFLDDVGTTRMERPFGMAFTDTGADFMRSSVRYGVPTPGLHVFGGSNEYRFGFELTPATRFEFSADIAYHAADAGGAARASAAVAILGFFLAPPPGQLEHISFNYDTMVEDGSRSDQFYGELRSGADAMQGYFNMRSGAGIVVNDDTTLPPIPEPQTYVMLLAGLALVGVAARRRHR